MKFPFLSKPIESSPWPCVNNPKTLSFRAAAAAATTTKTMNSDEPSDYDEAAVFRGLKCHDRLFFEPGQTSSILEEPKPGKFSYKETVTIIDMDSDDPFLDFRISMEEMVEARDLKNWDCLEDLLTCYLKVNEKSNHGYIVAAFVEVVFQLSLASAAFTIDTTTVSSTSTTTQYSFTSPLSSFSSSTCMSLLENENDVVGRNVDAST